MSLWLRERYFQESVNGTERVICGEGEPHEVTDDLGILFKQLRGEYGRCVSRIYIDTDQEDAIPIGWVFKAAARCYDECRRCKGDPTRPHERYIAETWCTLKAEPDQRTVTKGRAYRIDRKQPVEGRGR